MVKEAAKQKIVALYSPQVDQTSDSVFIELIKEDEPKLTAFIQSWLGSIQWICYSPFRLKHKRKNWYIGIFETFPEEKNWVVEEKDLVYQPIRSSDAGGQHVNKVSSTIRIIHIPSGLQLVAMDSRPQHQNKKLAKERLLEKHKQRNENTLELKEKQNWLNQLQIKRGNSIRILIGSQFKSKGSN